MGSRSEQRMEEESLVTIDEIVEQATRFRIAPDLETTFQQIEVKDG